MLPGGVAAGNGSRAVTAQPDARRSGRFGRHPAPAPGKPGADDTGAVKVVLALPSWDDYLRIALDDLIEAASRSPMVLLRARTLLAGLLNAAPPQRRPSITWRLQRAEELAAGNFGLIWRHTAGADPA